MWIDRDWGVAVRNAARSFPVVLLTGPRQVGKTSLLRHLYPEAEFLTFDDPALAQQAEGSPDLFFSRRKEPLVLDEVQYVPALFRPLKKVIDQRRRPGRFLMTGSQTFPLMQNVSESLAGRCAVLEMSSLSFREIRRARPGVTELEFLVKGGFPALHAPEIDDPSAFYSAYMATYLERDVRNLKNVGSLRDFDRFLRATAARTGQLLSYSDLARDVGVSPNTIRSWISVLEASGQVYLLEPYHRSLGKRLVKSPKLYFVDSGLACHLVGITRVDDLLRSPLAGALWETFVVGQVLRHFQVQAKRPPLWFWRTGKGDEVDLLIEKGARFIAIECKFAEVPNRGSLEGLAALAQFYGDAAIERAFVVCRTRHRYPFRENPKVQALSAADLDEAL
jgi:uncharacterized protein